MHHADDTGDNCGFFPCANFLFAPNQKQAFFLSGKGTSNFFPSITPFSSRFCEQTFIFTVCWINYHFISFCWTIPFEKKNHSPPPPYHLVGPLQCIIKEFISWPSDIAGTQAIWPPCLATAAATLYTPQHATTRQPAHARAHTHTHTHTHTHVARVTQCRDGGRAVCSIPTSLDFFNNLNWSPPNTDWITCYTMGLLLSAGISPETYIEGLRPGFRCRHIPTQGLNQQVIPCLDEHPNLFRH